MAQQQQQQQPQMLRMQQMPQPNPQPPPPMGQTQMTPMVQMVLPRQQRGFAYSGTPQGMNTVGIKLRILFGWVFF